MNFLRTATFGGLLAASTLGLSAAMPSQAAMAGALKSGAAPLTQAWTGQASTNSATGLIERAQFRRGSSARSGRRARGGRTLRRGRAMRRGRGYHRGRRGYNRGRRGYWRRDVNPGAAVAAGIFGAAVAAAIASSGMSTSQYHAACDRKYKTYDRETGTYMGYDGERHPCRL